MTIDWTIKVSDVLRIGSLVILVIVGYVNLRNAQEADRQSIVELKARQEHTDEALQNHIEREAEVAAKAVEVMNRMLQTMDSFPLHRHTVRGEIVYPKPN